MRAAWWWIDRWRKSTAYTDMTAEQQGVYRNLLDELWLRDGCIPNDERILAKIGGDPEAWPRVRAVVLARFQKTKDGLRHETHDEVAAYPDSQAEKGRKRAASAARAGGRFTSRAPAGQPAEAPAERQPVPPAQHQPPYSVLRTPSPLPSPNNERKRIPPSAASPDGSEKTPGWQTEAADDWIAEYGGNPPKQFFGAVKPLAKKHGWERVRPVLRFFLSETDIEFLNMAKFSGGFGQWEARMNGNARSRASPKVREQEAGFAAFIRGGHVDERLLGPGDGAVDSKPSTAGLQQGRPGIAGRDVPGGAGSSDG